MQLDRILQSQGFGSRKECRRLARSGAVHVQGDVCEDPFADFVPDGLDFSVNGETWHYRAQAYLLMNKPAGYECSRSARHHASIFELLPSPLINRGVQTVGRLDEDTTGMLLLSDDGQFIHRLISPKHKVPKVYEVETKHPVNEELIAALLAGVQLHDEPDPVAALACIAISEKRLSLTLGEGKYHQVKRMIAAAGNRVEGLRRTAIGGLKLPEDLPEGQWRWLEAADWERLWAV